MVCPVLNIKPHVPPIIPIHLNFSRETFLAPFTDLREIEPGAASPCTPAESLPLQKQFRLPRSIALSMSQPQILSGDIHTAVPGFVAPLHPPIVSSLIPAPAIV